MKNRKQLVIELVDDHIECDVSGNDGSVHRLKLDIADIAILYHDVKAMVSRKKNKDYYYVMCVDEFGEWTPITNFMFLDRTGRKLKYANSDTLDLRRKNLILGNRIIRHSDHLEMLIEMSDVDVYSLKFDFDQESLVSGYRWAYCDKYVYTYVKDQYVNLSMLLYPHARTFRLSFKNGDCLDFRKDNVELVRRKASEEV